MVRLTLGISAAIVLTMAAAAVQAGELFQNYYTQPGYGGTVAQLYVSPRPTPPLVGHTWITYQPFMPHEFLYPHARTYRTYHPGSGWTTTKVHWNHTWGQHLNPKPPLGGPTLVPKG